MDSTTDASSTPIFKLHQSLWHMHAITLSCWGFFLHATLISNFQTQAYHSNLRPQTPLYHSMISRPCYESVVMGEFLVGWITSEKNVADLVTKLLMGKNRDFLRVISWMWHLWWPLIIWFLGFLPWWGEFDFICNGMDHEGIKKTAARADWQIIGSLRKDQ